MTSLPKWLLVSAAIAGATGVSIGAFGAHGLPEFLQSQGADTELVAKRLSQFETGAKYHLYHALALLALAAFASVAGEGAESLRIRWPAILFIAGIFFFSGSLYVLVLTNTPWLGAITPIGGVAWIIGWVLIAFARPLAKSPSIH